MKLRLTSEKVGHWFGSNRVLHDINFKIPAGQIVSLVGASGCGKSTLFKSITGTHLPSTGKIYVYSKGVPREVIAPNRDRGIVYQQYTLMRYLTAQQNVALGLKFGGTNMLTRLNPIRWNRINRKNMQQAAEALEKVGLGDHLNSYPINLSGGQRQRVAFAQALITKPKILLLDEPFGALDEISREERQQNLIELHDENVAAKNKGEEPPYTIFIVTHELTEAIYVGERVIGLSRHWNWQDNFASCPGATIVYDEISPVFKRDSSEEQETFLKQRDIIRRQVFGEK
jgi:NitT/TauT family transport system ATP-binding protein